MSRDSTGRADTHVEWTEHIINGFNSESQGSTTKSEYWMKRPPLVRKGTNEETNLHRCAFLLKTTWSQSVHVSIILTEVCFCCIHQDLLHLEERLGTVNRGASQGTIERCTYPHKYKKVRRPNDTACRYVFVVHRIFADTVSSLARRFQFILAQSARGSVVLIANILMFK